MPLACFQNEIIIGSQNRDFQTDDNDDGVGVVGHGLTEGAYTWDTLRTALLTLMRTDIAAMRMGLSSTGHVTFDNNGGGNFRIIWPDQALRDLLGFTHTTLTGTNVYTGSRRIRGAWYPRKIINQHEPKGRAQVERTRSASGVKRYGELEDEIDSTVFAIDFVDNVTELVTPSGVFGSTYIGTGITDYFHAYNFWWRKNDVITPGQMNQGWRDGRPVRYFADSANAVIAIGAALGFTYTAANYTTWQFDPDVCSDWDKAAQTSSGILTIHYNLTLPAEEYVAP